jgi:PAS domain S-box-containing protein
MSQEHLYKIAAEHTSDIIVVVDIHAVVRYVSPSFQTTTGYRIEQYQGMDAFENIIAEEDRQRVRSLFVHVIQSKAPVNAEYRIQHAQGHWLYAEARVRPVLDENGNVEYVVAVVRDITEKKRSELALEESEQRYKSLFENNLDGVFSVELQGFYFENANRAFEEISGIELNNLPDRCFLGLISDEDHSQVYQTLLEVMKLREPRAIECRLASRDGRERIVSITFVPIFLSGELNGIHGIMKDITQRKQEERELIRSEERSNFLQQRLNRFANDLAGVMKVSELESRLLDEMNTVLQASEIRIEEMPDDKGTQPAAPHEIRVRIGENSHPVYLRIRVDRELLKIEKEWLDTSVHYVTILYDNLQRIEDLMRRLEENLTGNETPKWMLRLLFKLSEKERASLSADLHDSVLQDLIIWYRKLESLRSSKEWEEDTQRDLRQIEEGLLDAIHQIRITCNELRPPFLLKMGLVESLKSLFSYTRMFANYEIEFLAEPFEARLNEEQIIGIYRIVQEMLNNANKHSKAAKVSISLEDHPDHIRFVYSDDGVGVDLRAFGASFQHMGLSGIEKRVFSLGGEVEFQSAPNQGFHVHAVIPKSMQKGE